MNTGTMHWQKQLMPFLDRDGSSMTQYGDANYRLCMLSKTCAQSDSPPRSAAPNEDHAHKLGHHTQSRGCGKKSTVMGMGLAMPTI